MACSASNRRIFFDCLISNQLAGSWGHLAPGKAIDFHLKLKALKPLICYAKHKATPPSGAHLACAELTNSEPRKTGSANGQTLDPFFDIASTCSTVQQCAIKNNKMQNNKQVNHYEPLTLSAPMSHCLTAFSNSKFNIPLGDHTLPSTWALPMYWDSSTAMWTTWELKFEIGVQAWSSPSKNIRPLSIRTWCFLGSRMEPRLPTAPSPHSDPQGMRSESDTTMSTL